MEGDKPCLVCGARGRRLHSHAPGLEENFPSFRSFPCPACHNGTASLTARQFDTGMLKEHNAKDRQRDPRPEPERTFDLIQGTLDVLVACARADGAEGDPYAEWVAALVERLETAAVRLLWLGKAQSSPDLPPALGPAPAKNRKRWRKSGGPAAPGSAGLRGRKSDPGRLTELLAMVRQFVSLGADELDSLAPGSAAARAQRELVEQFDVVAVHAERVVAALTGIDETQLSPALVLLSALCAAAMFVSSEALITHPSAEEELGALAMTAVRMQRVFERNFATFLVDLGQLDPADALSRFMESTLGEWVG